MTTEYLEQMKADLLSTYQTDLCEESVDDIRNADTLKAFIGILHKYAAFLTYKDIPKIDWVRKWFTDYKQEAEQYGCYIDKIAAVTNPSTPIIGFGRSYLNFTATKPNAYTITLQDESECYITAFYASCISVRQKDNSIVKIIHRDNNSKIKIRTV